MHYIFAETKDEHGLHHSDLITIELRDGAPRSYDLRLLPRVDVPGRVLGKREETAAPMRVLAAARHIPPFARVTTLASDGSFTLRDMQPGTYDVTLIGRKLRDTVEFSVDLTRATHEVLVHLVPR